MKLLRSRIYAFYTVARNYLDRIVFVHGLQFFLLYFLKQVRGGTLRITEIFQHVTIDDEIYTNIRTIWNL